MLRVLETNIMKKNNIKVTEYVWILSATDSIDFIYENDGRAMLLGSFKHLTNA
jgi:hypothetical protein